MNVPPCPVAERAAQFPGGRRLVNKVFPNPPMAENPNLLASAGAARHTLPQIRTMPATPKLIGNNPRYERWRWQIFGITWLAYAGFYLTRKTFTICKTTIAKDLNWELGDTAHIWTAFLVAYMLGMFINSFIGRRWGPRVLLLGGLGFSIAFFVGGCVRFRGLR